VLAGAGREERDLHGVRRGATILARRAERRGLEALVLIAIEPARRVRAQTEVLVERREVDGARARRLSAAAERAGVDAGDGSSAVRGRRGSPRNHRAIGEQRALREGRELDCDDVVRRRGPALRFAAIAGLCEVIRDDPGDREEAHVRYGRREQRPPDLGRAISTAALRQAAKAPR
jgi:hypothetical protein